MEFSNYKLEGYVDTQVKGLCFNKDPAHPTPLPFDVITLLREPSNSHDKNAIKVTDPHFNSAALGYIAKEAAAEIAPLMDSGTALARAVISIPPPNMGSRYFIPCHVLIFSKPKWTSEVRRRLPLLDVSSKDFAFYPDVGSGLSLKEFDQMMYKSAPCIKTLKDAVKYYSPPIDTATRENLLQLAAMMGVRFIEPEWSPFNVAHLVQMPSTSTNAPPRDSHEDEAHSVQMPSTSTNAPPRRSDN